MAVDGPAAGNTGLAGSGGGSSAAGPVGATVRTVWRRYRLPLVILLLVVAAAAGIGLARPRSVRGELDPRAVDRTGSHALATLLAERGVAVRRLTRVSDAVAGSTDRTIVLVAFPDLLPAGSLARLGAGPAQLVLVVPDEAALAAVTTDIAVAGTTPTGTTAPGCRLAAATAAGDAELGGTSYTVTGTGVACYHPADSAAGTVAVAVTRAGGRLVVLGGSDPLTNGALDTEGDAALALNLLGADGSAEEVRWLVPSAGTAAAGHPLSVSDITPVWAPLAAAQLLVAAVLAAGWRARRLGPPVVEPLPVVVRSAETVEGRARLYQRGQARDRAAEALRAGALARLVPRLGLPRSGAGGEPDPRAVVEAVCARTGQPAAEVQAALYGPVPLDDAALVRLPDVLDTIVADTLDPEVRRS